jgi:MFS family permease
MDKKQFVVVFITVLFVWTVGAGLSPLLPVYAVQLGATPAMAGFFMASAMLMVSIGGLAGGWLSDRTGRRKIWILLGAAGGFASLYGVSQMRTFWPLVAFIGLLWFMGGTAIALSMVLVGLQATRHERGKLFGLLSMTASLGGLVGGAIFGPAAQHWGYPSMFLLAAGVYAASALLLVLLHDPDTPPQPRAQKGAPHRPALGPAFRLLLLASFVGSVGGVMITLARSLAMDSQGFAPAAISSMAMAGGLATLPMLPLAGWLSDRFGRKQIIVGSFILCFVGRCAFIPASQLWHFWGATALISLIAVSGPVKTAWASDLAPQESMGRALAQMNVSGWVGGVVGYALGGLSIEGLGIPWTFAATALSMLAAIGLLIPIRVAAAAEVVRAEGVVAAAQAGDATLP